MVGRQLYRCVDCGQDKRWEEITDKKRQIVPNLICNACIERRKVVALPPSERSVSQQAADTVVQSIQSSNK